MNRENDRDREPSVGEVLDEETRNHFENHNIVEEITRDETPVLERLIDTLRDLDHAEVAESTDARNKDFILDLIEARKTDPELIGSLEGFFGQILGFYSEEDLEKKRRRSRIFGLGDPKEEVLDKVIQSFRKLVVNLETEKPEQKETLQEATKRGRKIQERLQSFLSEGEDRDSKLREVEAFLERLSE